MEEDVMLSLDLLLILPETSLTKSVMEEVTAFLTPSEMALAAMVAKPDPVCAFLCRLRFDGEDMGERDDTSEDGVSVEMSLFRNFDVPCCATFVMDFFSLATRRYSCDTVTGSLVAASASLTDRPECTTWRRRWKEIQR